ncbi:MAG: DotU family type IV/VI secretion system protein [Myxococcales bacterium]|nr:DotU family type IV/VI secretion system protein [Myxococcales bacterium]
MDWLLRQTLPALEVASDLAEARLDPDEAPRLRARAEDALGRLRLDDAGVAAGYHEVDLDDLRLALAALLDELALRLPRPADERWRRGGLLQQRVVRATLTTGGDAFFEALEARLGAPRTRANLGVLRIFALCLELGFAGTHAAHDEPDALDRRRLRVRERLGALAEAPPPAPWPRIAGGARPRGGRWPRRLVVVAVVSVAIAGALGERRLQRAIDAAATHVELHRQALAGVDVPPPAIDPSPSPEPNR